MSPLPFGTLPPWAIALSLAAHLAAGVGLGIVYFSAIWWNARLLTEGGRRRGAAIPIGRAVDPWHRPSTVMAGLVPMGAELRTEVRAHRPCTVIPGLDPGINASTVPRLIPGSSPGMTCSSPGMTRASPGMTGTSPGMTVGGPAMTMTVGAPATTEDRRSDFPAGRSKALGIALVPARFALLGGVLTLASLEGALPLLAMALGILIARPVVMRRHREAAP